MGNKKDLEKKKDFNKDYPLYLNDNFSENEAEKEKSKYFRIPQVVQLVGVTLLSAVPIFIIGTKTFFTTLFPVILTVALPYVAIASVIISGIAVAAIYLALKVRKEIKAINQEIKASNQNKTTKQVSDTKKLLDKSREQKNLERAAISTIKSSTSSNNFNVDIIEEAGKNQNYTQSMNPKHHLNRNYRVDTKRNNVYNYKDNIEYIERRGSLKTVIEDMELKKDLEDLLGESEKNMTTPINNRKAENARTKSSPTISLERKAYPLTPKL